MFGGSGIQADTFITTSTSGTTVATIHDMSALDLLGVQGTTSSFDTNGDHFLTDADALVVYNGALDHLTIDVNGIGDNSLVIIEGYSSLSEDHWLN